MVYNIYKGILIKFIIIIFWIFIIFNLLFFSEFAVKNSKNSINILVWSGMYDLNYISKFEKENNIKVHFSYYESNEELLVKLKATKGYGYDLIIPSDYAVYNLKKEGLLKKLDKSKLNFLDNINPALLGHYFDKNNNYSLPAEWAIFGIAIDKLYFSKKFKNIPNSWSLIFDNKLNYEIAIPNDPLVTIPVTLLYLYKSLNNINLEKLNKAKITLKSIKKNIEAYTEFRPDFYLVNKSVKAVISSSAYIFRAIKNFDFIDFIVPKENTLITIENFAIPKKSNKEELVYKFINFLMEPETAKYNFESEQALFPVTTNILDKLRLNKKLKDILTIDKKDFNNFHFFRPDLLKKPVTEEYLREIFLEIKI